MAETDLGTWIPGETEPYPEESWWEQNTEALEALILGSFRAGGMTSTTSTNIGSGQVAVVNAVFSRPAPWNTYEVFAEGSMWADGAGVTQTVRMSVEIDGDEGPEGSVGGSTASRTVHADHEVAGLTAASINVRGYGVASTQGQKRSARIAFFARRTS